MHAFTKLTAVAAPFPMINVDTDMIIPKQFLRTIKRTGLGVHLFDEMRYDDQGLEIPDFVLNQEYYKQAQILIAGANFGCGSSREHAPWALLDFGFRCIIAPSFADIFFNNCFKNGILPLVVKKEISDFLMGKTDQNITVDLENQIVQVVDEPDIPFDVDPFHKHCLLNGLDDISLTLEKDEFIAAYEDRNKAEKPWLWRFRKKADD